jgi:hypothetical protein
MSVSSQRLAALPRLQSFGHPGTCDLLFCRSVRDRGSSGGIALPTYPVFAITQFPRSIAQCPIFAQEQSISIVASIQLRKF